MFIMSVRILIIMTACLGLCFSAPTLGDDLEVNDEKRVDEERQDFVLRRRLDDGEQELYVYSKGVWASKLSVSHPELYSMSLMMSTDGSFLVKSIYDTDNRLTDCDVLENEETIEQFRKDVEASVNDPMKSTTTNATLTFLSVNVDVDADVASLVDLERQKRECKRLQRAADKSKRQRRRQKGDRSKRSYLIFPGTNWCGKGNKAEYANHMGLSSEEDQCCRTHDMCPFAIEGFSSRFNVFNYRLHTLSHCDCDKAFKECLKTVASGAANVIGKVYFNVVNTQCFDLKLEKTCAKRSWWGTCDKHKTEWVAEVKSLGSF